MEMHSFLIDTMVQKSEIRLLSGDCVSKKERKKNINKYDRVALVRISPFLKLIQSYFVLEYAHDHNFDTAAELPTTTATKTK